MKKALKGLYLVLIFFFLYAPIVALMVLSFNDTKTMGAWKGFTWRWYEEMLGNPQILNALMNTLVIALVSAAVATVIGVAASVGILAFGKRTRKLVIQLTNIPLLNAEIVTALSLMLAFAMFGISLSMGTVFFSHICFCLPYVILNVMPKLRQNGPEAYEAAQDLGASPVRAFFEVVLPEIMPGVTTGFLLSFTMSVDDFVITYFTRGAGINTLSTLIYSQVKVGIRPSIYALSTVIFILVFVALLLSNLLPGKAADSKTLAKISETPEEYVRAKKRGKWMKRIGAGLVAAVLAVVFILGAPYIGDMRGTGDTLYFYNYGDYIDPDLLDEFERETGITVVMDTFDTNESMYPIVAGGQVSYDLIVAGDYTIEKMIANDLLAPINYDNIPNIVNIDPIYMEFMDSPDPGNQYAIPYNWGTVGILYNTTMIPEGSITSWQDLWNPDYEEYGILMMDSVRDTFMAAELILGFDMNTTDPAQLQQVVDLLIEQQGIVAAYENDNARDDLITGDAGIGMIYSGEYLYCIDENPDLAFVVPEEGTNVWFDCFVIPKNAQHKEAAEMFINFMLDGEVGYKTFEYLTYPSPNVLTLEMIDEEIREDEAVFPTEETLSKCDVFHYLGQSGDDLLASYWKKFRGN